MKRRDKELDQKVLAGWGGEGVLSQKTTKNRPLPYVCPLFPSSAHFTFNSTISWLFVSTTFGPLDWVPTFTNGWDSIVESLNRGWSVRLDSRSGSLPLTSWLWQPDPIFGRLAICDANRPYVFFPSFLPLFGPPNHSKGVRTCTFPPSYHFFFWYKRQKQCVSPHTKRFKEVYST